MTAIEKMIEWLENDPDQITGNAIREARRLAAEEKAKPAPVEARDKAYGECKNVGKTCRACHAEHCTTRVYHNPVEAKATADGSLVEYPCPTCGAERFKTERRINGDSWCRFGHKHPTKDFVRPASPAVEGLVRELRSAIKNCRWHDEITEVVGSILAKYDNAKGGK